MEEIPGPMHAITGDPGGHVIQEKINNFFENTVENLSKDKGLDKSKFILESCEISYNPPTITDDRCTYLFYKNKIIANVLETRTEHNNLMFHFFKDRDRLEKEPQKTPEEFLNEIKEYRERKPKTHNYEEAPKVILGYLAEPQNEVTNNKISYLKHIEDYKEKIIANALEIQTQEGDRIRSLFKKPEENTE